MMGDKLERKKNPKKQNKKTELDINAALTLVYF